MKIEAVRLLIREKVEDGRLPHEAISRVQSCPADGEKCDACERRITMAQFVVRGALSRVYPVARPCFQLWDEERLRALASPRDSTFAADIARIA